MRLRTASFAFGFTLAATTCAVPLSQSTSTVRPLFSVVSQAHAGAATGMANVTGGEVPNHEHNPDCEHNYNTTQNTTTHQANSSRAEAEGHATEGMDPTATAIGNPSPYPRFNASSVRAHNHTAYSCAHPWHHNGTSPAGNSYDKKSMVPVCMGADCQAVRANVDSAGGSRETPAKHSKRRAKGQDAKFSYEDVAGQMSGARIAGGT